MFMVHEMRRLRAEHAALSILAGQLAGLVEALEPPPASRIEAVRTSFRDILIRHLKCEDWALYPRLFMSGDEALARLAREFVSNMGDIAERFTAYDRCWTAERVTADWAGFRDETTRILALLAERIDREERELYPRAEAIGSGAAWVPIAGLRRAAR